jgi:hypothetical protein
VPTEKINLIRDRRSSSARAVQAYSHTQEKNAIRIRTFVYLAAAVAKVGMRTRAQALFSQLYFG